MRVEPDDAIFRINAVFLGPKGFTLPWAARYVAYGVGFALFALILLVEALLPFRDIGIPPTWELCIAIGGTFAIMNAVDHDRSVRSVIAGYWADLRALLHREAQPQPVRLRARVKIKGD